MNTKENKEDKSIELSDSPFAEFSESERADLEAQRVAHWRYLEGLMEKLESSRKEVETSVAYTLSHLSETLKENENDIAKLAEYSFIALGFTVKDLGRTETKLSNLKNQVDAFCDEWPRPKRPK